MQKNEFWVWVWCIYYCCLLIAKVGITHDSSDVTFLMLWPKWGTNTVCPKLMSNTIGRNVAARLCKSRLSQKGNTASNTLFVLLVHAYKSHPVNSLCRPESRKNTSRHTNTPQRARRCAATSQTRGCRTSTREEKVSTCSEERGRLLINQSSLILFEPTATRFTH